jgi:hypothetical protein
MAVVVLISFKVKCLKMFTIVPPLNHGKEAHRLLLPLFRRCGER